MIRQGPVVGCNEVPINELESDNLLSSLSADHAFQEALKFAAGAAVRTLPPLVGILVGPEKPI